MKTGRSLTELAQEIERQHIVQELHDDTIQELIVIANRAQDLVSIEVSGTNLRVKQHAEWIRDSILRVSDIIRRLVLDLRPSILDDMGLVPAVRWLVDRMRQESGINVKLILRGTERKLDSDTEIHIFRIVQEALNNVRRHSNATEASVSLKYTPEVLKVTVRDNGIGFLLGQKIGSLTEQGKLGLLGMQQRAKFLGSTLGIYSRPNNGTRLSVETAI